MIKRDLRLKPSKIMLLKDIFENIGLSFDNTSENIYKTITGDKVCLNTLTGVINLNISETLFSSLEVELNKENKIFTYDYYIGVDEVGVDESKDYLIVTTILLTKLNLVKLFLLEIKDSKKCKSIEISTYSNLIKNNLEDFEIIKKSKDELLKISKNLNRNNKFVHKELVKTSILNLLSRNKELVSSNSRINLTFDSFSPIETKELLTELNSNILSNNFDNFSEPNSDKFNISVSSASILSKFESLNVELNMPKNNKSVIPISLISFKNLERENYDDIKLILPNLSKFYPGVINWWEKTTLKNESSLYGKLIYINGSLSGLLLSKHETNNLGKIRTLYIKSEFQNKSFGDALFMNELNTSINVGIKSLSVTLAQENSHLLGYFNRLGFFYVGHSYGIYRDGVEELHLEKFFSYDLFYDDSSLIKFILENLFSRNALNYEELFKNNYLIQKKIGSSNFFEYSNSNNKLAVFNFSDSISLDDLKSYSNLAKKYNSKLVLFVKDKHLIRNYKNIELCDYVDLRKIFYPLDISFDDEDSAIMVPIQSEYVNQLFLNLSQTTFSYNKESYMLENVYYCDSKRAKYFKRGKTVYFYESSGKSRVIGKAFVTDFMLGTPKDLIKKFSKFGCLTEKELLNKYSGEIFAFKFSHYQPLVSNIPLKELTAEIFYTKPNLITSIKLTRNEHIRLNKKNG